MCNNMLCVPKQKFALAKDRKSARLFTRAPAQRGDCAGNLTWTTHFIFALIDIKIIGHGFDVRWRLRYVEKQPGKFVGDTGCEKLPVEVFALLIVIMGMIMVHWCLLVLMMILAGDNCFTLKTDLRSWLHF